MSWVAVAVGGGALVGAGASYLGSKKQADAAKDAAGISTHQFDVTNAQQQPFIQSGYGALSRLNTLLGLSPGSQGSTPSVMAQNGIDPSSGYGIAPGGRIFQAMPEDQPQEDSSMPQRNGQLKRLLSIRAAHGDPQAAQLMRMV